MDKLEVGKRYLYDLKSRYEQDHGLEMFYRSEKDEDLVVILKEPPDQYYAIKLYWEKPRVTRHELTGYKYFFITYGHKIMPYLTLLDNYLDLELLYN